MTGSELAGNVAVIIGGGCGIGLAIAQRFAAAGAQVVVGDLRPPESSGAINGVGCDVAVAEDVAALLATAADLGTLGALVTSAGYSTKSPIDEMSVDDWRRILDVNLTGTMLAIRHAVPLIRAGSGGSIVTIASIASFCTASPYNGAYADSKGAVAALTRGSSTRSVLAGIRINAIAPGVIRTPLVAAHGDEWAASRSSMIPLRRLGRSDEIAAVALFLARQESSYITGQMLIADGGVTSIVAAPPAE